jgi:hypothetical protein
MPELKDIDGYLEENVSPPLAKKKVRENLMLSHGETHEKWP